MVTQARSPKYLLDIVELSRALSLPTDTVREWARDGRLPLPVELHGHRRWRARDIARWVANQPINRPEVQA